VEEVGTVGWKGGEEEGKGKKGREKRKNWGRERKVELDRAK
jgi:hypothetical protein